MTRAERERCLDLDADPVRRYTIAVMAAVYDKAAGLDGCQRVEAGADPVLVLDRTEGQSVGDGAIGGERNEVPHRGLIGGLGKMNGDVPAAGRILERGDGGVVAVKAFGQNVGDAARSGLVGER